MSRAVLLKAYGRGWQAGDADAVLAVVAPDFVLEDPAIGTIPRNAFADYLKAFKIRIAALRPAGADERALMEFSEFAMAAGAGEDTAWAWWRVPSTSLEGGGLIKIGDTGIRLERLTYFATPGGAIR